MDQSVCPGAKLLRQAAPELFRCPGCGQDVEIWTDELSRPCGACGKTVYRDATMGCLDWCAHGKECVGDAVYEKYMNNKAASLKRRLLEAMARHFGADSHRIEHARAVLGFAEELLHEEEADWHIVVPAAILHDVGIPLAEAKYGSAPGPYQEKEGPPVAREILLRLGCRLEDIRQICDIIGHHHSPDALDTTNFRVLCDADALVNLRARAERSNPEALRELIDSTFLTPSGRSLAYREYAGREPAEQRATDRKGA